MLDVYLTLHGLQVIKFTTMIKKYCWDKIRNRSITFKLTKFDLSFTTRLFSMGKYVSYENHYAKCFAFQLSLFGIKNKSCIIKFKTLLWEKNKNFSGRTVVFIQNVISTLHILNFLLVSARFFNMHKFDYFS